MTFKKIVLASLLAGIGAAPQAFAATDAERIAQLEAQLKLMQAQLAELKASAAKAEDVKDIRNQMEASVKENVVVGDIPGSFRIPGTETSIHLYGIAELNLVREGKGDNGDSDYATFLPYAPLSGSAGAHRSGQTYLHGRTSRIGIEGSTPTPFGQVMVKVEGDFNNDPRTGNAQVSSTDSPKNIFTQQVTNSYNFRLRHAYVQAGPWLAGQTWSTFMDIDNTPETVDFNGPIGSTFLRQPQLRYTYATPESGNFTVALENPVSYVYDKTGSTMPAGFSKLPDLVMRWDKPFTWGALSLRGVTLEHRLNDGNGINVARRGMGLAASGQIKTVGDDFISWMVTGGSGIGRYFNYIEGAGYDEAANRIRMERVAGLVLGYQRKVSDTFRMNFVYGLQKNRANEYTDWAAANGLDSGRYGINRKLSQLHVGAIWNPIKPVDLGAEYIWGRRETLAGETGGMSRVNLLARYNLN
ncbi:DcaP family trimeric outer membrane transporter [Paucibacter soli]|uniref:DcaP family trimeric outer membrane transporter n=1 Tax=Paucibacter soli TaxID=3133433 RepID=UPI0030A95A6F